MKSDGIATMWHRVIQSEENIIIWSPYKTELPGGNWWYWSQCYIDTYERCQWTYLTSDHHITFHRCRQECPPFHAYQFFSHIYFQLFNMFGCSNICSKNSRIFLCMVQRGLPITVQVGKNWLLKCYASNYVQIHQENSWNIFHNC